MSALTTAFDILHLNNERGWRGGENQVLLLARRLAARSEAGLSGAVACPPGSELAARATAAGLPVLPLPAGSPLAPRALSDLVRLVARHHPRLLHAHTSRTHTLALLASALGPARLVVTRRVDRPAARDPVGRLKYRLVTRFAAVSARVRDVLVAGGIPPERVDVIRDGIEVSRVGTLPPGTRAEARAGLGLGDGDLAVGITAHFSEEKDLPTLLRAWATVEGAEPKARLFLVGHGALEEPLRALAASLHLSRAVFAGWREDIPRVLAALDVFVLSSESEGLGSSLMDAMGAGLPVVATRVGGIPEIVREGEDGLLVPPKDPSSLARALLAVLEDPGLRARLGAEAGRTAQGRFSADRMAAEYVAFYRRALGEAPAP